MKNRTYYELSNYYSLWFVEICKRVGKTQQSNPHTQSKENKIEVFTPYWLVGARYRHQRGIQGKHSPVAHDIACQS